MMERTTPCGRPLAVAASVLVLFVTSPSGAADGPPAAARPAIDPKVFETALADLHARDYAEAAAGFWGYIQRGGQGAPEHEWAQFFLAESLAALGLWHAATHFYTAVATSRTQPALLPDALARLERITRERPFDEEMIYEGLLYESDFGTLPRATADWTEFVQGLYDLRRGFLRWASRHFVAIDPKSPYALEATYALAVQALADDKTENAISLLESIAGSAIEAPAAKNRANLALARLLFDIDKYEAAAKIFDRVEQIELSFEQAHLLLEKAWTAFWIGDYRKSLGLLHTLEAPSYERYFLPDAFVLRGLLFHRLCQYMLAKRAVRGFRYKYEMVLRQLHERMPMEQIEPIYQAATQDGPVARRKALLQTLAVERRRIEDYDSEWEEVGLDAHLRRLYDLTQKRHQRRLRAEFARAADRVANELLETEELIHLLDYEIGLDIFKRVKMGDAALVEPDRPLTIPYDSDKVYYEFDDEYWNDELHDYEYFVKNRCLEAAKP